MKKADKYLTERDQNKNPRDGHKHSATKQLRFERIKKQSITVPLNMGQESANGKKFIYDQQTMNQMIQTLKQQNNQLKTLVRVQQTQLNYFGEQQKNMLMINNNTFGNSTNNSSQKKLQIQSYRLKKQVQALEQEIIKIKKTIKCTSIKQLQTINKVYEQQIKTLTSKLAGYEKSTTNIKQLNKIIQKEYFISLKNKQLQAAVEDKNSQLEHSSKIIRKLKNIISQKNNQIERFKEEKQKMEGTSNKNKNMEEYVHKSQLITKKKQLLAMTETIQKLQVKLLECESKAQNLQQENIENMNRETSKRKQILVQFQKLKKSHEALQQALALSLKKNSDMVPPMRLSNVPSLDTQFRKPKMPATVSIAHIKQVVEAVIYSLQEKSIDHEMAVGLIMNNDERQKLNSDNPGQQLKTEDHQRVQEGQVSEGKISIREVIYCLEQPPFSVQNYEYKEILARYLVEDQSDSSEFINFDSFVNISYARSIFKKIIHEYPIFTTDEITEHCLFVEDFLKRNQHTLKTSLSKAIENPKILQQFATKPNQNQKQVKVKCMYKGSDYLQAIIKENQLNQLTHQFIKYWTYTNKDKYLTYKEFQELFRVEGVCTFITEDPQENDL